MTEVFGTIWRPVETAPKDARILAWCIFPAGGEVRFVTWRSDYYNGAWMAYGCPQEVTHWMPVPPPPNSPADRKGEA